jgi:soluble lytic murein transglycosylase
MLIHFKEAYPKLKHETQKATLSKIVPKSQYHFILPALVHAIIRRESCFDANAKSEAGAIGLMQLMPKTASKEISKAEKRYGISFPKHSSLTQKDKNIVLGTTHIVSLLEKFDGSLILSIAAYNAGSTPVDEWIQTFGDPREKGTDLVTWIECIPFAETRNYVQRVLENFMVYQHQLQDKEESHFDLIQYLKGRFS